MNFIGQLEARMNAILQKKNQALIAIDGRCASGKTTLANMLCEKWDAAVIHMDDFFLRPEQRTKERLAEPGGNVDRERFLEEVLIPLKAGHLPIYRPYNCHTKKFENEIALPDKKICVVEGSYTCHPMFVDAYDLRIFVTTEKPTQLQRIEQRNREFFKDFVEKWIPYEECYFKAFQVEKNCDLVYQT